MPCNLLPLLTALLINSLPAAPPAAQLSHLDSQLNMLPTHLRDQTAQRRAASLRMNAQSRLASASARGPVASSPSGPKPSTRFRTRGGAGATSKGLKTAVARSELDDELREARAERSSSDNDSPEAAPVEGKLVRAAGKENAVEVPLELLVVPGRRSESSPHFAPMFDSGEL